MTRMQRRLGHGVGLRPRHFRDFLDGRPQVDWVEAISENFMVRGGRPLHVLEKVRRELPVVLHGVSLSVGSSDPLDGAYLRELASLVHRIEPVLVSDHLCWGSLGGKYAHDLWPLPYTDEAVSHVVARVDAVQEALGRSILLENVSSYVAYRESTLTEWEFISQIARRSGCGILLDLNNVYVSSRNHGFDPHSYLAGLSAESVQQLHLAGHTDMGRYLLDSHDAPVSDAVWELYDHSLRCFGRVPTCIEWDDEIPALDVVLGESRKAAALEAAVLCQVAS